MHGLHHYHLRKRISQGKPESRLIRAFDRVIYLVAAIGPLSTLPQAYQIWSTHDARSISVFTWSSYVLLNVFWFAYGCIHREKPIMLAYTLWIIVNSAVALGAILYG